MDGLFGENPIKMDDLEVPPFIEPPFIYIYITVHYNLNEGK